MTTIDKNTIEALRGGDHRAFERVFDAFFGRVKAFIFGYVKSVADAEELAEEVFVGLWMNRAALDPSRSFGAYLHTVARNSALNFLRRKFVRDRYADAPAVEGEGATPEEEIVARETALLIEMAVERMPAQRREIYRLSRGEGLTNGEIAERLGTTKRTVESQLSAALKEIKKVIHTVFMFLP